MVDDRKAIERAKQDALLHYINGGVYDSRYDRDLIRYLINVGYLGWDMTDDLKDYHWTTAMGLIYLRSRGYDVPAPKVRNGRIVGVDECDRLVDWIPPEPKGQERKKPFFGFGRGLMKRNRRAVDGVGRD